MGVTLGGADRHPGGGGDLLEREAEGVLENENACLGCGQGSETVTKAGAELRELCLTGRRRAFRRTNVVLEEIVAPGVPTQCNVPARVHRQPMKPRRECRLAAEPTQADAELGKRFLGGVTRVLGIVEDVVGESSDARRMTLAQRLERSRITVLCAPDEYRVAESIVCKLGFGPKRSADPTAGTSRRLHQASLLPGGAGPAPVGLYG